MLSIQVFSLFGGLCVFYYCGALLFNLFSPALVASKTSKYAPFPWLSGDRSISNFYQAARDSSNRAQSLLSEGYKKLRNSTIPHMFPFPIIREGFLLLLPRELIPEYSKQPDHICSFPQALADATHTKYTFFSSLILDNGEMHSRVIRQELTQKLAGKMEAIMEELSLALHDELAKAPQGDNGIVKMNVWNTTMRVVARTSNRVFLGLPLCRNQEYLDAAVHFGITINSTVLKIRFMPALLRPILGPLVMIPRRRDRNVVAKHLNPIIKERMDIIKEINNDELAAKRLPNDVLTSLMFAARKEKDSAYEYTPYMLVNRMLALHFASIYTSTLTFTNVLFDLISLPPEEFEQTVASMREEVDNVLKEEGGWTRVAAYKMTLIDSFIKESIRMNGIGAVGLEKKVIAREGFTFSNGVHVPQNTSLGVPVHGLHHDPEVYPDPDKFDGARFARMRADTEDTADGAHILREGKKVGMTTTSPDYLPFGHGKHACPGRFFAANELKLLLAHIVTEYDLLPRARPKPTWVSVIILPDTGAEILMRKRQKPVAV